MTVRECRSDYAQISVQGPKSRALLQGLTGEDFSNAALPYYSFRTDVSIAGIPMQVSRLGFTGELGYELLLPVEETPRLWTAQLVEGNVARGREGDLLNGICHVGSPRRAAETHSRPLTRRRPPSPPLSGLRGIAGFPRGEPTDLPTRHPRSPRWRRLTSRPAPVMIWSCKVMPGILHPFSMSLVIARSAAEGSGSPAG
ncbi:hypothetical protein G5B31_14760 [Rhodobacter sp. SGA-6-6]|nr:hypothetical protein [Rhodobacter sp. SGA-6-6]